MLMSHLHTHGVTAALNYHHCKCHIMVFAPSLRLAPGCSHAKLGTNISNMHVKQLQVCRKIVSSNTAAAEP